MGGTRTALGQGGPPATTWQPLASLHFQIQTDGFSFGNYRDKKGRFENDISKGDLIRMFGLRPSCEAGTTPASCVEKASAREWMDKMLSAMDIGHCEGIAVASLRLNEREPFKGRVSPAAFQPNANTPFAMRLDDGIENYIAYYWITQTFPEVIEISADWAQRGPHPIVDEIVAGLKSGKETYTLGIQKLDRGRLADGHALVPFSVEENGTAYRIGVYDSNFPGQPRYLFVDDNDQQSWHYNSKGEGKGNPDYKGALATHSLYLTPTSVREDRCFTPEFKRWGENATNCGLASESRSGGSVAFLRSSFLSAAIQQNEDDYGEFFLTGDGEMLVVDSKDRGIGYDPVKGRFVDDIPGGIDDMMIGGLGMDAPHFFVPSEKSDEPWGIVFSGKFIDAENTMDFVFSDAGFTVGFTGIQLDAGEVLGATVSPDGQQITFIASADGETPDVFFAFDGPDDNASYIAEVGGVDLAAGKELTFDFDLGHGKLFISDNDGNQDKYDIVLRRIMDNGREDVYESDDVAFGKGDRYEMDFANWKGEGDQMCFKEDDEGDGFADEKCIEEPDEGNGP
jgi:hypothetical protein